ncbi:MAG TPA: HAD-IA family hydrolase [Syntrophorhabdaceae bacterium]|nr:HAD-IA family hydrolase [Syntrophorhabdaceae bacterium]
MIRTIIFDFDGVLVESNNIKTEAFSALFKGMCNDEQHRRIVQHHIDNLGVSRYKKFVHIYRNILGKDIGQKELDDLSRSFSGLVMERVVKAPSVNGAMEFLQNNKDYKCYIVSATPHEEINEIVRLRSIKGYFAGIYGSPKEKEELIDDILVKGKHSTESTVYVGDGMNDYRAAKKCGVHFIARIHDDNEELLSLNCPKIRNFLDIEKALSQSG